MINDDIARAILDAGTYVVLATANADGVPWASPVWFADDQRRFAKKLSETPCPRPVTLMAASGTWRSRAAASP